MSKLHGFHKITLAKVLMPQLSINLLEQKHSIFMFQIQNWRKKIAFNLTYTTNKLLLTYTCTHQYLNHERFCVSRFRYKYRHKFHLPCSLLKQTVQLVYSRLHQSPYITVKSCSCNVLALNFIIVVKKLGSNYF